MKRFVTVFLAVLMMLTSVAATAAEGIDVSSMTDEELHSIVDAARNELAKRELTAAEDTVLFEQNGVTVYLTGEYEVADRSAGAVMGLEAVVVNDTDEDIAVYLGECAVNGWDTSLGGCILGISSGKKKKDSFSINLYDADISKYEEITDIDFKFRVLNGETYVEIFSTDEPVTVHFNG